MNKKTIAVMLGFFALLAIYVNGQVGTHVAIGVMEQVLFLDHVETSAPANPPAGVERWFASSATNRMACITSTGADCTTTPTGTIVLTLSLGCPAGFTNVAALDGKMPLGTLTSHANTGTTGGSDTLTPTFMGDALPGHQHETPFMVDDGNLVVGVTKSSVYGVGLDMPGYVQQLNNDGVTTSGIGSALTEDVSAGTPTGTNSTEDNRSAFVRVLFCAKN